MVPESLVPPGTIGTCTSLLLLAVVLLFVAYELIPAYLIHDVTMMADWPHYKIRLHLH